MTTSSANQQATYQAADSVKAKPTHRVYFVQEAEGPDNKSSWLEIGAIWPHKDGKGGSVSFKITPTELFQGKGRLVYREIDNDD